MVLHCQILIFIKQVYKNVPCSYSNVISEALRLFILVMLQKVTKPKTFSLHQSTMRQMIYKWKSQHHCSKIILRAQRINITRHKWQRVSKDLQATLALSNANVHESTIRQTLNKNRMLPVWSLFNHIDMPKVYWKNGLQTNESKKQTY